MFRKIILSLVIVFVSLSSCSTRKNSLKNRAYNQMTSWFNTLFNGQQAMDGKLKELSEAHEDDYFTILPIEPYGEFSTDASAKTIEAPTNTNPSLFKRATKGNLINKDNSSLSGFEKAEEKALKVIAKRSMIFKGEERNKVIARAYLMLGQARYYQGKPFQALDALQQVEGMDFDKNKPMAKYFMALAQIQAGNKYAAAEILDKLYKDEELKKKTMSVVASKYAQLFYEEGNYESAINGLSKAIENTKNKKQRARLYFIQGQMLSEIEDYALANEKFKKAYKLKPGFEMEARAKLAIALNFQNETDNYLDFIDLLDKAKKTGTYEKYLNEFLYAQGQIEEKRDSIRLAELDYLAALRQPISSPRYRAETYAALGKIKFNQSDYVYANAYYDSAVSVIPNSPRKEELSKLSKNLDKVMEMHYLVLRNDSILNIAALSPADQKELFELHIENLKKQDEERRLQEEQEATVFKTENKISSFGNSFGDSGKFYFYSTTAKSNGENEFKRIWGNISLKDNWRTGGASATSIEQQKAELTGQADLNNPRRYDVDYYLEKIPSKAQQNDLKQERDTVELALGIAYIDDLKDAKLAEKTLTHLMDSPPRENETKLEALYQLYRIYANDNEAEAEKYKAAILKDFPKSLYAQYLKNPSMNLSDTNSPEALALYKSTYDAYKEKDYKTVFAQVEVADNQFSDQPIIPKFALLKALSLGQQKDKEAYLKALNEVSIKYKDTEEAAFAKKLYDYFTQEKSDKPKSDSNAKKSSTDAPTEKDSRPPIVPGRR